MKQIMSFLSSQRILQDRMRAFRTKTMYCPHPERGFDTKTVVREDELCGKENGATK
jgi:hypothetical protein